MPAEERDHIKRYAYSIEDDYILQRRAQDLAGMRQAAEPDLRHFLTMRIADIEFSLYQCDVAQIISPLALVPVPFTDPCIMGITWIRGEMVSVVDIAVLLDASLRESRHVSHAILLEYEGQYLCLGIDHSPATLVVPADAIHSHDRSSVDWALPILKGMFLRDHSQVGIISVEHLYHLPRLEGLARREGV